MAQQSILQKYQVPLLCAVLILLVIAAFEPVRHNDFIDYDDPTYVLLNYHIHPGITADSVKWAFTSGYAGHWLPLTWLSFMIDIELFELDPLGYHLHNLGLHIASVVLLFLVLRHITGSLWCSFFAAVIFGIHPLRVESVAWVTERKDVLYMFFCMLTLAAYVGYVRRPGVLRYLSVVVCMALGLMAKPLIMTLPLVFLLLDIWPLGRLKISSLHETSSATAPENHGLSLRRLIGEKIPLLALSAASCIVTYYVQASSGTVGINEAGWSGRMIHVCVSYAKYLLKTVWPVNLAPLYPFPENGWPMWQPVAALLVLLGLTAGVVCFARKRPWLPVGWFWYILTFIPVIGLVQIGVHEIADRYTYLPSIGLAIMLIWTLRDVSAEWKHRGMICAVVGGLCMIVMIAMTRTQVGYWKDSVTLNKHTLDVTENNYSIYTNLAVALRDEKKYDEAIFYLQKALQIRPDFYLANINMAGLLTELHRGEEALIYAGRAIKQIPDEGLAYFIQGGILAQMGKEDQALEAYKKAAMLDPDDFRFYYEAGLLLVKKGSLQEAIRYFKESVRCNPAWGEAWRDMGLAQQRLGLIEDALSSYRMTLKLISRDHVTCYRTAVCFEQIGHPRDAIYFYRQALSFNPDFAEAMDKLAWLLATSPFVEIRNPSEALLLAQKANQIAGQNNYWILDTLAAAYAAGQQFQEAAETVRNAITLAQTKNDTAAVGIFTARLELYRKNLLYLEQAPAAVQNKEPSAGK